MRYYQNYQKWIVNENNLENIQIANNNIAIAKSSENPNQIGRKIGNALGRLNKIDTSSLNDDEKTKFIIAFEEINKLVTANQAQPVLNKAKRQQRFDKIGEIMPQLKGDLDDSKKEEDVKNLKQEQTDDPGKKAEDIEEPKQAISQLNDETKDIETVKNSIKANIQTGKQITNSSKLPLLSQKLSGKATPDEVKFVQAFLKSKGYLAQNEEVIALGAQDTQVDGNYGPSTAAAVSAYQQENKLKIDGVVGTDTWNAMLKDLGNTNANVTAIPFDQYKPQQNLTDIKRKDVKDIKSNITKPKPVIPKPIETQKTEVVKKTEQENETPK